MKPTCHRQPATLCALLAFLFFSGAADAAPPDPAKRPAPASATASVPMARFTDTDFLHRWHQGNQYEFTPPGQEDLQRWTDMLTLVYAPNATTSEGVATFANACLETYKKNGAKILQTRSVPMTPETPAEHLVVAVFGRPQFIETVFARFQLSDGLGRATIYTHRKYGADVGKEMSAWLAAKGETTEKALMALKGIPSQQTLAAQLPSAPPPATVPAP